MTFILIIYIDLPNFVNVTMYCYIHVICSFSYYMFSWMYDVTKPNRCPSLPLLTDKRQALTATLTTGPWMEHVCPISYDTSFAGTLEIHWNDTWYTFCQYILYTVYCITTVLLKYTISGKICIDVVTLVIFIILLFIKILYNKLLLYAILTLSWHCTLYSVMQ